MSTEHAAPLVLRQTELAVATRGRGTLEITAEVDAAVRATGVVTGLCHLFVRHTSASLAITENADPVVRDDLERFLARIAPDGDALWRHDDEGPDDMPAHIRSVLTNVNLTIPISGGRCALGTWQGIFLWEHRRSAQRRSIIISVQGSAAH
jgi:secondary thiamine-phosphate synthase enzyme